MSLACRLIERAASKTIWLQMGWNNQRPHYGRSLGLLNGLARGNKNLWTIWKEGYAGSYMDNSLEEEVGSRKVREVSMLYMVHAESKPSRLGRCFPVPRRQCRAIGYCQLLGEEKSFFWGMFPLVCFLCFGRRLHTHVHVGSTSWT